MKYDWERTKKEVSGNWNRIAFCATVLAGLMYLIYIHFFEWQYEYNVLFLTAVVVLILFPIAFGLGGFQNLIVELWVKKRKLLCKILTWIVMSIVLLVYVAVIFIGLPVYVLQSYNFKIENIATGKGYFELTFILVIVIALFFQSRNLTNNSIGAEYRKKVNDYIEKKDS